MWDKFISDPWLGAHRVEFDTAHRHTPKGASVDCHKCIKCLRVITRKEIPVSLCSAAVNVAEAPKVAARKRLWSKLRALREAGFAEAAAQAEVLGVGIARPFGQGVRAA